MVWCGVAWCDVCGVVCCSSFFFSFILFRRRSKKVALPVHLLRQVFILCVFSNFFALFFRACFWNVFFSNLMPKLLEKVAQNHDLFEFLGYFFEDVVYHYIIYKGRVSGRGRANNSERFDPGG